MVQTKEQKLTIHESYGIPFTVLSQAVAHEKEMKRYLQASFYDIRHTLEPHQGVTKYRSIIIVQDSLFPESVMLQYMVSHHGQPMTITQGRAPIPTYRWERIKRPDITDDEVDQLDRQLESLSTSFSSKANPYIIVLNPYAQVEQTFHFNDELRRHLLLHERRSL